MTTKNLFYFSFFYRFWVIIYCPLAVEFDKQSVPVTCNSFKFELTRPESLICSIASYDGNEKIWFELYEGAVFLQTTGIISILLE